MSTPGGRLPLDAEASRRAARRGWDDYSAEYQAEHGEFLRDDGFIWCPEGLDEAVVQLLGPVRGRRVLEVGCGAGQCSRWLLGQDATVVGIDLSREQLRHSQRLDERTGTVVPVLQADAQRLPLADASVDLAFSAFGAVPFAADVPALIAEVARVLRPGGTWVFSVTHPIRWCFPDDAGTPGLVACLPYWDRTPYVELDENGTPVYVEHHRTLGDYVRAIVAAGLELTDLVEPEWPPDGGRTWGGWSQERGRIIPGTAIFCCEQPPRLSR
jgi:SAM-dependent methyltransferase